MGRAHRGPFAATDDLVVTDDAGMGVERRAFLQGQHIVPFLAVDEHHALTGAKCGRALVHCGAGRLRPVKATGVDAVPSRVR